VSKYRGGRSAKDLELVMHVTSGRQKLDVLGVLPDKESQSFFVLFIKGMEARAFTTISLIL